MIRLFLNGLSASAGAGLTYIRNVVPRLSACEGVQATVALSPLLRSELGNLANIVFLEVESHGVGRRFWWEQTLLPRLIMNSGADVLISTGNFALRSSPVPQILLSGNSLYTSKDFYRDLRARHEYSMWLDTHVRGFFAQRSIHWADCTVAPSQAFAGELRRWAGGNIVSIYHGFDPEVFFRDETALPSGIAQKLLPTDDTLRLLFVSHYNYYRNFETLFRALPLLKKRLKDRRVRLFLTCKLSSGANPGSYCPVEASNLIRELGVAGQVVELGTVPYNLLHQVYRSCDVYVTAAYAETFAHPLVEAMASGLPVVASDLPTHREICGGAAVYFPRFSHEDLAEQILKVACAADLARSMAHQGTTRSNDFSWHDHVEEIISLAFDLRGSSTNQKHQTPGYSE